MDTADINVVRSIFFICVTPKVLRNKEDEKKRPYRICDMDAIVQLAQEASSKTKPCICFIRHWMI